MAPKSRRKKKYVGQRSPQAAPVANIGVARTVTRPEPPRQALARPVAAAPRVPTHMAPSPSAANVGREIKTIAVLAGVLLVALVVLSIVLP
jgi:hypothetical protein